MEAEAARRRARPQGQRDERDASATMAGAERAEGEQKGGKGSEEDNGVLLRPPFGLCEENIFVRDLDWAGSLAQNNLSSSLWFFRLVGRVKIPASTLQACELKYLILFLFPVYHFSPILLVVICL